jgi:hypothetical protein
MTANDTNRLYSLKMTVVVVEARIEAREIKLDARASFVESLASIRASSPIIV